MNTREKVERAAYTAVGAPVAGMKVMRDKAGKLADTVRETRRELKTDAVREFDEWVAEGEMVVDRMIDWLRSTGAGSEMRSARKSAADQVRAGVAAITDKVEMAVDIVEPGIELTEIRGIGPANAEKLATVGVAGVAAFLDRTSHDDRMMLLADETGISPEHLAEWRLRADLTQVDGIATGYQRMLNAAGIGTVTHLANADAKTLTERLDEIDQPGMPRQAPSRSDVADWIKEARRLSL